MSTATRVSKEWQHQTVEGKFPLLQELGGSGHSSVFLTDRGGGEPGQAAIKLIPAAGSGDDAQLARWAAAAKLDHPHLLRLFESGRCDMAGAKYLYIVMEYAEENLSQILPQRPLSPAEASFMLQPMSEVLAYLHQAGFVHGRVRPSNILAVDNQLKISADSLFPKGEVGSRRLTAYDAPEVSTSGPSPESDVWSLGVTLVAALTQHAPDFTNSNPPQAIVPETIPQPFREIARRCLTVDPGQRSTLAEIQTQLQTPAPPAPERFEMPAEDMHPGRRTVLLAVIGIALLVLVLFGVRAFLTRAFLTRPAPAPAADHTAQPASGVAANPSPPPLPKTQNQPKGTVPGKVSRQVVPTVPQSARNTITGKIKVNVQVSVDPSGKVADARLVSHVESKYFARLALESARQWRFTPAQLDGQAIASKWTLRFQFARAGAQVFPTEVRP
jgi:TonB family protein